LSPGFTFEHFHLDHYHHRQYCEQTDLGRHAGRQTERSRQRVILLYRLV